MNRTELKETLAYYRRQKKAMEARGGAAEAYLPMIRKLEKQLAKGGK